MRYRETAVIDVRCCNSIMTHKTIVRVSCRREQYALHMCYCGPKHKVHTSRVTSRFCTVKEHKKMPGEGKGCDEKSEILCYSSYKKAAQTTAYYSEEGSWFIARLQSATIGTCAQPLKETPSIYQHPR